MIKKILSISLMLALFCSLLGCTDTSLSDTNRLFSEIYAMNTYITQTVYGENMQAAIDEVNKMISEKEELLSLFVDNSDINNINKNAGISPVKVNNYTLDLIVISLKYCKESNGDFDITIAPLTSLWNITGENPHIPIESDIDYSLSLIDYKNVIVNTENKTVFLKEKDMALDLGGIAKGYICKDIRAIYDKYNVPSALVSIGGNIMTYNNKPDGSMYTLGLRNPLSSNASDVFASIQVEDKVVATTGGYERYFIEDNVRYHHILSTQDGYPVNNGIISVTVISDDGGYADFMSTALYIGGLEKIKMFLDNPSVSIIAVDEKNNIYASDNIKNDISILNNTFSF